MPVVSVIIPCRNASATIGKCLIALKNQDFNSEWVEIIVVDDGSTDDTAMIAVSFEIVVLQINPQGPATARNHGAKHATAPIILFTDADFPQFVT